MARVSIEDCQKVLPNRFALVTVAANRARQLMGNCRPLVQTRNKFAVTALREIAEGKVIVSESAMQSEMDPFHSTIEALLPTELKS